MKPIERYPLVPGAQGFAGHAPLIRASRIPFFESVAATGPIARLRIFGRNLLAVTTPELAHEVLVEKAKSFRKSPAMRLLLEPIGGEGLFTSEGDLWKRQRRLMSPLFHHGALTKYAAAMNACAVRATRTWRDGATVDLAHEATRITMAVVGKTLFDSDTFDETDELGDALTTALQWTNDRAGSPGLVAQLVLLETLDRVEPRVPSALRAWHERARQRLNKPILLKNYRSPAMQHAIGVMDRKIQHMIDERRAQGLSRDDLLTRLLTARDDESGPAAMSDRQVRDEATTLFVAGHETTATALAWAFYLLARNPDARARVQREADAFGPDGPTAYDPRALEYTTRVFKESLRMYPPVPIFGRQATEDVELLGSPVPRFTIVFVSPHILHYREPSFPDPQKFDPDRFAPEAESKRHRAAWIPFGAGPRVCIGNHFALMEGPMVLATLMRRATFEIDATRAIEPEVFATLRPKGGVPARVTLRESS